MVFSKVKEIKKELIELRNRLNKLLDASVDPKKAEKDDTSRVIIEIDDDDDDDDGQSTVEGEGPKAKMGTSTQNSKSTGDYTDEINRLKTENEFLEVHFNSVNKLIDQVLEDQQKSKTTDKTSKAEPFHTIVPENQNNKSKSRLKRKGNNSNNRNHHNGNNLNRKSNTDEGADRKKAIIFGDSHVKRLHNLNIPNGG